MVIHVHVFLIHIPPIRIMYLKQIINNVFQEAKFPVANVLFSRCSATIQKVGLPILG